MEKLYAVVKVYPEENKKYDEYGKLKMKEKYEFITHDRQEAEKYCKNINSLFKYFPSGEHDNEKYIVRPIEIIEKFKKFKKPIIALSLMYDEEEPYYSMTYGLMDQSLFNKFNHHNPFMISKAVEINEEETRDEWEKRRDAEFLTMIPLLEKNLKAAGKPLRKFIKY